MRDATPHGTNNGYVNYRCRCEPCVSAARAYRIEYRERTRTSAPAAGHAAIQRRIALWRGVYLAGHAGAVCDEIVRNRPAPPMLVAALFGEQLREAA